MANLLGGLIEETEANRFKNNLIEESELTYRPTKLQGFEDDFEFTKNNSDDDGSERKVKYVKGKYLTQYAVKKSLDYEPLMKNTLLGS